MDINEKIKPQTVILGFFDGLHQGHEMLLQIPKEPFAVLTFKNIPHKINNFLYDFDERIEQLKSFHPQLIYWMDVTKYNMSAKSFCQTILQPLGIKHVVVGSDYRFGNDWQDVSLLQKFFNNVSIVERTNVATSQIKKYLMQADVEVANKLLIYPYYRKGIVIQGNGDGKKIGFPTANIAIEKTLIELPSGSYVSTVEFNHQIYRSISFIGNSKTMQREQAFLETHIFDFNANLYGQTIKVNLLKYIRSNEKFNGVAELIRAIKNDTIIAKDFLRTLKDVKFSN